jgi:hypothetical protein
MVFPNADEPIKFIAFIDLLGMKEASDTGSYYEKIREFINSLLHCESYLNVDRNEANVYVYSDCAFVSSSSCDSLFNFLIKVRDYLISNEKVIFFKCAVVKGNLRGLQVNSNNASSIVSGMTFNLEAIEAYRQHQLSKAIGIRIANNIENTATVYSMHFPVINGCPESYKDLYFPEEQLISYSLDKIVNAMYISRVKSRNLERYYTSLLCTWFQSINLTSNTNTEQWYLFELILGRKFEKKFHGSNTIIYFYFLVLNKIYNEFCIDRSTGTLESDVPDIFIRLENYLLSLKKIETCIEKSPPWIIDHNAKELLLKRLSIRF